MLASGASGPFVLLGATETPWAIADATTDDGDAGTPQ